MKGIRNQVVRLNQLLYSSQVLWNMDARRASCGNWSNWSRAGEKRGWSSGMSSSVVEIRPKAREVSVSDDELTVLLADGRRISVPLVWFPRLLHATADQRQNFQILGEGEGIHWPEIDEDLSVAGLLRGVS